MRIQHVPVVEPREEAHRRQLASAINLLISSIQIRGSTTLTDGSEVISDERIGDDATVLFIPKDSGAAGTQWYATVKAGEVELFYESGTGGEFQYIIIL